MFESIYLPSASFKKVVYKNTNHNNTALIAAPRTIIITITTREGL